MIQRICLEFWKNNSIMVAVIIKYKYIFKMVTINKSIEQRRAKNDTDCCFIRAVNDGTQGTDEMLFQ